MKTFCIAGPVKSEKHYFIARRIDENSDVRQLIEQEKYFIIHAPRQTGKTTALLEFVKELNRQGQYEALYVNVEPAQAMRSKIIEALRIILDQFKSEIVDTFGENDEGLRFFDPRGGGVSVTGNEIFNFLEFWSKKSQKPIVLFIDEIDSLVGDTLISVLRQIRAGYKNRPGRFPQSIGLVGVRDVRDYRVWSDEQNNMVLGGSAFNIKAESIRLADFSFAQVQELYNQHTRETGQKFTDEAIDHAFYLTQGQPWLVNALAYQACFRDVTDRNQPITKDVIERSKEALIKRRDTHIDVLVDRLHEPRVRHIIEAILVGGAGQEQFSADDVQYARDLGLIKQKELIIANSIYQEIIPRELTWTKEETILYKTAWYVRPDGSLDMHKLLASFAQFFRENSDVWLQKFDYKEAGPHLLLMAFLQRILNGGGTLHREYALGRGRVDLLVTWKNQKIVIELKLLRGEKTLPKGLEQTAEYIDINNATEGHLIIFDRSPDKSWDEKVYEKTAEYTGKKIAVWGM